MNRRKALTLSLLSCGLLSSTARAQDRAGRGSTRGGDDFGGGRSDRLADNSRQDFPLPGAELDPNPQGAENAEIPPANFHEETGYTWFSRDISRYTSLAYDPKNPKPQNSILEWIFRRTGSAIWHGEKIAVLSAGQAQLRAYHSPQVLEQVREVVDRFTKSTADLLSVTVRFVAAQDPRWRYAVQSRMNRLGTGPHGQQIWLLSSDDTNLIWTQLLNFPSFKRLADQTVKMVNGQTLTIETADGLDYVSGPQREGNSGLGFQQNVQPLKEGVSLRFSPLLTYDGDALEAAVDLQATTIKRLIRTRVLTSREFGSNEMSVDVPEVTETRLNVPVKNWPLGQTLLISGGITPGILQSKTGFLNLRVPGTVPTDTELLVFINVEPLRDRGGVPADEPPPSRTSRNRSSVGYDRED